MKQTVSIDAKVMLLRHRDGEVAAHVENGALIPRSHRDRRLETA